MATTTNTVIIGAGIIGSATAYYLSESSNTPAQNIHLIESADELFKCASGFAGGFLAADWFSPASASLGALSFKLHKELADSHDGRKNWGYSPTTTSSLSFDAENAVEGSGADWRSEADWLKDNLSRAIEASKRTEREESDDIPKWLAQADGMSLEVIGSHGHTAQVDPLRLSQWLLDQYLSRGVHLHQPARALSISTDIKDELASIRIAAADDSEIDIPCSRIIITSGAWTPQVFRTLFPSSDLRLPIAPLAGHSLVLKSPRWTPEIEAKGCHAIYATDIDGFSPEIFSRLGGELYIAGLNSTTIALPGRATEAVIDNDSIKRIKDVAIKLLGLPDAKGEDLEVTREALCFRPVTGSGRPILARIGDDRLGGKIKTRAGADGGVFIAAGHGAWGISQSLGTGKVMSEMIEGQPLSANIKSLGLP